MWDVLITVQENSIKLTNFLDDEFMYVCNLLLCNFEQYHRSLKSLARNNMHELV